MEKVDIRVSKDKEYTSEIVLTFLLLRYLEQELTIDPKTVALLGRDALEICDGGPWIDHLYDYVVYDPKKPSLSLVSSAGNKTPASGKQMYFYFGELILRLLAFENGQHLFGVKYDEIGEADNHQLQKLATIRAVAGQ